MRLTRPAGILSMIFLARFCSSVWASELLYPKLEQIRCYCDKDDRETAYGMLDTWLRADKNAPRIEAVTKLLEVEISSENIAYFRGQVAKIDWDMGVLRSEEEPLKRYPTGFVKIVPEVGSTTKGKLLCHIPVGPGIDYF